MVFDKEKAVKHRVFISNVNFNADVMAVKDVFRKECGSAFVDLLTMPSSGKAAGAAVCTFRNEGEVQLALGLTGTDISGRSITVEHDPENKLCQAFAEKKGLTIKLGRRGTPMLIEKDGSEPVRMSRKVENQARRERPSRESRIEPDRHEKRPRYENTPRGDGYTLHPIDQKHCSRFGMAGKPLINDLRDLGKSILFFTGFSFDADERQVKNFFMSAGKISNITFMISDREHTKGKSRGCGTIEFFRARDAARALIMLNNTEADGRRIGLREGRERRELPEGLTNLGRPLPEPQVADQCRQQGIDPFQPAEVYLGKICNEATEGQLKEIFELVGDAYHFRCFKHADTGKMKNCTIKLSSALDAQQCINVLHDATFLERPIACRFEKLKSGSLAAVALATGAGMPVGNPNMPTGQQEMPPPPMQQPAPWNMQPPQQPQYQQPKALPPVGGAPHQSGTPPAAPFYGTPNGARSAPQAPPRSAPQAPPAMPSAKSSEEEDMKKLAGKLGISAKMLKAIRVLAAEEEDDSKSTPTTSAAPNAPGNSRDYTQENYKPADQTPQQSWTPTTADTIYIRNIPSHFNELRLRNYMNECGRVTFMDFPLKADGRPVGYAYVRFAGAECRQAVKKAVDRYNRCTIDGCMLEVGQY